MTIITNNNGQTYQTAGIGTTTGAILAGSTVGGAVTAVHQKVLAPKLIKSIMKQASEVDTKTAKKGMMDAFEKSGLKEKGTEILDVREVAADSEPALANKKLAEALEQAIPKRIRNNKQIFENAIKPLLKALQAQFEAGQNAAFIFKPNKIAINSEKMGIAAFHEMGHALNRHSSKFWHAVQHTRVPAMFAGGAASVIALFKRKKLEGEEPKNNIDKATTFIKNNVGTIAALSCAPIVAEELAATYKGEKLAKQVLSPETLKKVKNLNRIGALSYISLVALTGLGAYIGSKVRDAIAKPEEI